MKLELIVPAIQENILNRKKALLPHLGLAMVAALTPSEVEVSLTDENVTEIDFQKEIDLVGITALTITAKRAYRIADTFRAKGVKVILGGSHPSALPKEAGQHADAVVIGEAEGIWAKVIEDFKTNKLKKIYSRSTHPSLINLPIPRRDLFAKKAYYIRNTISTSRGCPYSCSFCSVTSFFGHTYRCRPVEEILKEIERVFGERMQDKGKSIYPNVDFFSGFVYDCLGIPREVYTPLFAMSRIAGWCAHRLEELISSRKIIRPAYKNVAGTLRYLPLVERN